MKYSIIFLVEEESDDFASFFRLIYDVFTQKSEPFEILIVDNATGDFVKNQFQNERVISNPILFITFYQKVSPSVCLNAALRECCGELILTLGPFQELRSQYYAKLIDNLSPDIDIVLPFRKVRKDPILNKIHSKLLNLVLKIVVGEKINDIGCKAKLLRREVLEKIDLYGNMFRYLPAIAAQKGFKIKEVECEQQKKVRKTKLYSLNLYLDRLVEITNLFFSTNFSKKPLRFFSLIGSGFISIGIAALLYIGVQKLFFGFPIGNRQLLMVAVISVVAGAQFASFGLLGEIISFVHGRSRKEYTIEKMI